MSKSRLKGALAILFLVLLIGTGLAAWGEVTFEGSQTEWWYCGEHTEVCGNCFSEYCEHPFGDHYSAHLGVYNEGDWAYVALNTAERFTVTDITEAPTFKYIMVEGTQYEVQTGPRMAFALTSGGDDYLLISQPAAVQTGSCVTEDTADSSWELGTWDGKDLDSFAVTAFYTDWAVASAGAALNYNVAKAIVAMGVVGGTLEDPNGTGVALIDNVELTWELETVSYGGAYNLEPEWDEIIGFDDGEITGPPSVEPIEWAKWCNDTEYCPHCLPEDDQNLWDIVFDEDLPSGAVPNYAPDRLFPSGDYAIYFGTPVDADYDEGEAAVGAVCSPYNELNPGDRFVDLSFWQFREVEEYMGQYDWTYVQIWFDKWDIPDGVDAKDEEGVDWFDPLAEDDPVTADQEGTHCDEWKTVWYRDSSDGNYVDPETDELAWEKITITHYVDEDGDSYADSEHRIRIPPEATRMRIRFGFNSVDGHDNNHVGWIVDDIKKSHTPSPSGCRIITDHLPQGEVNDKYPAGEDDDGFLLDPQVNTSSARGWSIRGVEKDGEESSLPGRLALDPSGRLYGDIDPGTAGTYEITFELQCEDGTTDQKVLFLTVRAPHTGDNVSLFHEEDFDTKDTWDIPGVEQSCNNLWHQTDEVRYVLDPEGPTGDEYGNVAYFGKDDYSSTDPNYSCSRAKGCFESPWLIIGEEEDGEELIIGFKSWRNVENYAGDKYDRTWVDVRKEGGNWITAWEKSSQDQSAAAWTWQEAQSGLILQEDVKIMVRFCFDSIDSYKNSGAGEAWGWLVDEISLYAGASELSITGCPRDETSIGEYYNEEIVASGGSNIVPIWEIAAGELPPGLGLVEDGRKARITGVARGPEDRYEFTIRVRDADWEEVATRECSIWVGRDVALLFENFEDDPTWGASGLWHVTDVVDGVEELDGDGGNHAAYYGKNDATDPSYATGARTNGMLTLISPEMDVSGVEAAEISFRFWREVESFGTAGYDKTTIQVKFNNVDWTQVWSRSSENPSMAEWIDETIPPFLIPTGATTMSIRFVFDSVDKWYNGSTGWIVDNIKIMGASASGANPLSAMSLVDRAVQARGVPAELQVINIPNPVKDVHTTTFMVRSVDVEAMKIQIFDVSGVLVFEEEIPGNELEWHTVNDYGEYLANGIYLYRAYVRIGKEWIQTDFQKLVILR